MRFIFQLGRCLRPVLQKRKRVLLEEESDASAIDGALSSIEASLTAAASSGTLGSSLEAASSAAGVESVLVSPEVMTAKLLTKALGGSFQTDCREAVESISARLSALSAQLDAYKRISTMISILKVT